jgi:tetratricopeptide (TPR) repeat protein
MSVPASLELDGSLSVEDLSFLVRAAHDVFRFSDSIAIMKRLIEIDPALEKRDWLLFGTVYKDPVDQIRSSLRALTLASLTEKSADRLARCEQIQKVIDQSIAELQRLCKEAINIILTQLLPAAKDPLTQVFLHKLVGDMFRYISEYVSGSEPNERASAAYKEAISLADGNLRDSDPFKLGTVLNFAVFNHEQLGNPEIAIDLVKTALERVQKDASQLSEQSTRESLSVVHVMQSNLSHWEGDDEPDEEEEEDTPE